MTHILITDLREIRYMAYVPEEPKHNGDSPPHPLAWHEYERDLEKAKRDSIEFDLEEGREKVLKIMHRDYKRNVKGDFYLTFGEWREEVLKPGIYQVPVEVEVVDNGKCDRWCNDCKAEHWTKCTHRQVARIVQPKEESRDDERKIYDEWGRMLLAYSLEAATNKVEDVGSYVFQKLKEEGFSITRKRG